MRSGLSEVHALLLMSGIAGIIRFDGHQVVEAELQRVANKTPWRSPAGTDVTIRNNAGLAQLHFTPAAQQPYKPGGCLDNRRVVIAADARLDNEAELTQTLRSSGHLVNESCSTIDILFSAWSAWGQDLVNHLHGDFALAIWDSTSQTLFLVRDPLGGRSLFYYHDGKRLIFASEISQILAADNMPARVNEGKIAEYVVLHGGNQEETFYEGILHCPPANLLEIDRQGIRKRRYWDIDPEARIRYRRDQEYTEHFLQLVKQATLDRIRTTGPIGLSLSGGLDSTMLAAIVAQNAGSQFKTFSYVFDELIECDEREYIQPLVDQYRLDAHYTPADDLWTLKDFESWPMSRDYIWSDAYAWLPHGIRTRAANHGCRLLINGQYGDALFSGGRYWLLSMLHGCKFQEIIQLLKTGSLDSRDLSLLLRQLLPDGIKQLYRSYHPRAKRRRLSGLHPDFIKRTDLLSRLEKYHYPEGLSDSGSKARYAALFNSFWQEGRGESRRAHLQLGMEVASPYFDRRIVEFIMAVPAEQLDRGTVNRLLQRNAMRGLVPEKIHRRRKKTDFTPLMQKGLLDKGRQTLIEQLKNPLITSRKIADPHWLENQLGALDQWPDTMLPLWLLTSVEFWLRKL